MRKVSVESIEKFSYTCDICTKEIKSYHKQCIMCGKDLCSSCIAFSPEDAYTDYPSPYCCGCLEKGRFYLLEIDKVRLEADEKETALRKEWKILCQCKD